jgi:hypothetical protein
VDREVSLAVPPNVWTDLQLEAGRQGVGLEEIIEHAVILRLKEPEDVVRWWRRGLSASRLAAPV